MNTDKIEDVMSELLGEGYRIVEDNGDLSPVIDWVDWIEDPEDEDKEQVEVTFQDGSTRTFDKGVPMRRSGTRTSTKSRRRHILGGGPQRRVPYRQRGRFAMSGIDWEAAANHWIDQEAGEARMPEGELIAEIEPSSAVTRSARWPRRGMVLSATRRSNISTPKGRSGSSAKVARSSAPAGQQERVPGDP